MNTFFLYFFLSLSIYISIYLSDKKRFCFYLIITNLNNRCGLEVLSLFDLNASTSHVFLFCIVLALGRLLFRTSCFFAVK